MPKRFTDDQLLPQPEQVETLTEPGVYRTLFQSEKHDAENFQHWVFRDVLPCIRKHGCYPAPIEDNGADAVVQPDKREVRRVLGQTGDALFAQLDDMP